MKKIFAVLAIFALALSVNNVYAKENETDDNDADDATVEVTAVTSEGETIKVPVRAEIKTRKAEARENIKSEIETRKQELETKKQESETKRAEVKMEIKNRISERLTETMEKSSERLTKELNRFREIQSRIETRIEKLEKQGAVATEARAALEIAIEKLSLAETEINSINEVVISEEDPRMSLDKIKIEIWAALEALRTGHKALMDVLPAMRGLQAEVNRSATSTRESN